jgi:hypothetical protein
VYSEAISNLVVWQEKVRLVAWLSLSAANKRAAAVALRETIIMDWIRLEQAFLPPFLPCLLRKTPKLSFGVRIWWNRVQDSFTLGYTLKLKTFSLWRGDENLPS